MICLPVIIMNQVPCLSWDSVDDQASSELDTLPYNRSPGVIQTILLDC